MSALAAVIVLGAGVGFALATYRLSSRVDADHARDVEAWRVERGRALARARGYDLEELTRWLNAAADQIRDAFEPMWTAAMQTVSALADLMQRADLLPPPTRLGRLRWRARHAWWRIRERFSRAVDDALDGGSATW